MRRCRVWPQKADDPATIAWPARHDGETEDEYRRLLYVETRAADA